MDLPPYQGLLQVPISLLLTKLFFNFALLLLVTAKWLGLTFADPGSAKPGTDRYAFCTNKYNKRVQVARSSDFETCTMLDTDALAMASIAPWETRAYYWDPDVIFSGYVNNFQLGFCIEWHTRSLHIDSGKWALIVNFHSFRDRMTKKPLIEDDGRLVLHYSGENKGVSPPPMRGVCHLRRLWSRWAISPHAGTHRNGGDFNNGKPLIVGMPIYVQNVERDGVTKFGDPVTTLDRDESDGPLVEAPSLIRTPEGL
ncbi:hypothetical protein GX48_01904 [Paracoccidioides brasiliensis]|nr:hypothetical protein GX48_01904 [Paracoccidioides brasiliensis]